jgi:hypothetical protein
MYDFEEEVEARSCEEWITDVVRVRDNVVIHDDNFIEMRVSSV